MKREPLTQFIGVNLTASERLALERMAEERGATLSGVLRKLIREAAMRSDIIGAAINSNHETTHRLEEAKE